MKSPIPFREEWGKIAVHYFEYALYLWNIEPDTEKSRGFARVIARDTGIDILEVTKFMNAVCRGHVGQTVTTGRAEKIAVAFCLANKKNTDKWLTAAEVYQRLEELAVDMGEDVVEVLKFNEYLKSLL